jgi:hypothetical protein
VIAGGVDAMVGDPAAEALERPLQLSGRDLSEAEHRRRVEIAAILALLDR